MTKQDWIDNLPPALRGLDWKLPSESKHSNCTEVLIVVAPRGVPCIHHCHPEAYTEGWWYVSVATFTDFSEHDIEWRESDVKLILDLGAAATLAGVVASIRFDTSPMVRSAGKTEPYAGVFLDSGDDVVHLDSDFLQRIALTPCFCCWHVSLRVVEG